MVKFVYDLFLTVFSFPYIVFYAAVTNNRRNFDCMYAFNIKKDSVFKNLLGCEITKIVRLKTRTKRWNLYSLLRLLIIFIENQLNDFWMQNSSGGFHRIGLMHPAWEHKNVIN